MFLIYTVLTIVSITVIIFFNKLKIFLRLVYLAQDFPGPKVWPLLGNAYLFFGAKPHDVFRIMYNVMSHYGKTVKFWFGLELIICMMDTKDVEFVLGTNKMLGKADEYNCLTNWLCEGLLISKPQKWFKRRRILTPAFHFKILEYFIEVFDRSSHVFLENLHKAAGDENGLIIMDDWVNLVTLDVICVKTYTPSIEQYQAAQMCCIYYTVSTLILIIFAVFFNNLKNFLRLLYLAHNFPGPKAWPLLGNAYLFFGAQPEDVLIIMYDVMSNYGKTVKFWLGLEFFIYMLDTKDVAFVLGSNKLLVKSKEYDYLANWLREGLLISKPKKWFKRRRILTHAFHFKILEYFIEVFDRSTHLFLKNLHKADVEENGVIIIDDWVNLVTLDVICETAMGVSVHAQTNADSEYVRAVKTISTVLHKRMFDIIYRFNLTYQFTKLARDEKKALSVLHGFTEKIIVQRREELLKARENNTQNQSDDVGSKRKLAFLDILLQSEIDGKPLTNLDIREEVDTFMFEGHDTTSSAITFCFYNLAMYPKYQQKCFEEIIQVFGKDKSKPVTYEDLNNLHYVELCIKETLRLFPSVPMLGRKVTEECEINGKLVPAGTNIGISPLHLGRQEELFPDANTFKPERFEINYANDKMSPYAYIPFSAGPRNCIGQKFAMLEIKTILANVLRHYELDYAGNKDEELLLIAELILRSKDPLMFKIKPRVY